MQKMCQNKYFLSWHIFYTFISYIAAMKNKDFYDMTMLDLLDIGNDRVVIILRSQLSETIIADLHVPFDETPFYVFLCWLEEDH